MTGIQIPTTVGVSGTFRALEQTSPIVQVSEGVATTTSMRVANGTQNEHASVLRLIRDNLADFEEYGLVGFEIRPRPAGRHGGGDVHVAILNEEQSTLLMTYLRNNEVVKDFKRRLVREFYEMRKRLSAAPTGSELLALAVIEAQSMLTAKDARIAELEPKAEFYDELMEADGTYSMLATSKMLGWGRNVMMRELRRAGVLQGNNLPYQRYEHHFKVTPGTYVHPKTGERIPTATTTVRPSGVEFMRKKLVRSLALVAQS
jgi:phage regulator Rha-like protein